MRRFSSDRSPKDLRVERAKAQEIVSVNCHCGGGYADVSSRLTCKETKKHTTRSTGYQGNVNLFVVVYGIFGLSGTSGLVSNPSNREIDSSSGVSVYQDIFFSQKN
jgi:hypothetical protein